MGKSNRQKLTPLSLDELIESAGKLDVDSGLGQFLQGRVLPFRNSDEEREPRSEPSILITGAPVADTSDAIATGAPVATVGEVSGSDSRLTRPERTKITGALVTGAPVASRIVGPQRVQAYGDSIRGQRRIQRAITVQKGQTSGETLVLDAMWNSREAERLNEDCRRLTIGKRTLANRAGLTYNNTKVALVGLSAKLAIEEQGPWNHTDGTTYLIYSYREILRRREKAGMTHYIKTKGVVFVDPLSGHPLETSAPVTMPNTETGALETVETGAPLSVETGAPVSTPLSNRHLVFSKPEDNTSSSPSLPIADALLDVMRRSDDAAARRILEDCRKVTPDISEEEVAQLIRDHGPAIAANRGLENPMGVLIRHIPKTAYGESFKAWRARNRELLDAQRRRQNELEEIRRRHEEEWRRSISDPSASEEEKRWAQRMLFGR